ncbi:Hypothetical predicted protein [Paramuricea clavata]|uniref:Uncharacterized protein n=1 Tax=Paramuricea clavata TaxID=317549 RepID=A0A7D9LKB7_PARCT|nr:Hypothetical predicted protein [Paramuricea clavata]
MKIEKPNSNKTAKAVNKQQESDQPRDQNKTELDQNLDRYQQRFTGIGKAMRNGEEISTDNCTNERHAQKPQRVTYQLTEPLKQRLAEFEENDIIESVPEHEAITWCSLLVVQPKPKNPEAIRACLDLRLVAHLPTASPNNRRFHLRVQGMQSFQ